MWRMAASALSNRIDKWQSDLIEFVLLELRQQAVTKRLGGDTGLVG